jgi:hypothetical protein
VSSNADKSGYFSFLKNGLIYQHFETKFYSNYLDNEFSKDVISIALENIGEIFEDNGNFIDIYNNKYNEIPYEKKWKNCNHWDKYTAEQFISCISLCNFLLKESKIEKNIVPTNVQKNDISNFKGICYRSNYESKHYDLNPNWDFEKFKTEIEKNG